jgi:predicted ester cyclase
MKLRTIAIALTTVSLAAGCGGKKKEDGKGTPKAGTGTAAGTGSATPTPPPPPQPAPLTGDALAKAYIATWNALAAGDKAAFRAAFADDAVSHWPDNMVAERKGADAIVASAFDFKAGFPDLKVAPQIVLVKDRTVAGVWLNTGTNSAAMKSDMGEMPASGKKIGQLLFHAATFNDANKVVDEWFVMDMNTMMNHMGMSPQPGRPLMETGAASPVMAVATGSDTEKANLALAQAGNDAFNKRDVDAMLATMADDVIESDQAAPADVVGKAKIAEGTKMFLGAFSDGKIAPVTLWAAGDYVVSVATFSGTNDGDMGDMKKTGKKVTITIAELMKYEGGKLKQTWRFFNSAGMAMQMGLVPPPGAAPTGEQGKEAGNAPKTN